MDILTPHTILEVQLGHSLLLTSSSHCHLGQKCSSSSACHRPPLLVAITVYCCFALFRVAVLVLVHVVVVFVASDFLSRFLKRDGGLNLSLS